MPPICTVQDIFLTCANTLNYTPNYIHNSLGIAAGWPSVVENCGGLVPPPSGTQGPHPYVDYFTDLGCNDVVGGLSGYNEVPANDEMGVGSVFGSYDAATKKLTLSITYSGLTGGLTASHIHNAAAGAAGPVLFNTGLSNGATAG